MIDNFHGCSWVIRVGIKWFGTCKTFQITVRLINFFLFTFIIAQYAIVATWKSYKGDLRVDGIQMNE